MNLPRGGCPRRPRQRGIALITAMLVVALAAAILAAMVSRQQLDIRRSANMGEVDQIRLYARGIGDWAGWILIRDRKESKTDHLNEAWAMVPPPIPVENGQLAGYLTDMQGRFNLNSLLKEGKPDPVADERFRRLLALLGLDSNLATVVEDWLDEDINPGYPVGGEDYLYLGLQPAYRAANREMVSASELLLISGIDQERYKLLLPHVSVLPGQTAINVNTATAQVLMSLAENISERDAQQLIEARGTKGYTSVADFLAQGVLAGRKVKGGGLSVASDYFMANSDIQIGRIQRRYHSLLHRNDKGGVDVLMQYAAGL